MKRPALYLWLFVALGCTGNVGAGEPGPVRPAMPVLQLRRGVTIDRQLHQVPPEPYNVILADDIRLIKSLGFEFVKLVINPEVFKRQGGLDDRHLWYFDRIVNLVVAERLPVVVCIHPEDKFKRTITSNAEEFSQFERFMVALGKHMKRNWTPEQLALQLMTEPYGSSPHPEEWNYWDKLQKRLWKVVRGEMPGHTLILSGDMAGAVDGLAHITPVNDDNVLYTFTFYEPNIFTWQGAPWAPGGPWMPYLKNLSYPSGPEVLKALPGILASAPAVLHGELQRQVESYAAQRWDREKLAARIGIVAQWRSRHGGRPKLWCAEFGCYQPATPVADRIAYIADMRKVFDRYDIGWAYWSYNEAFSVMRSEGRVPSGPPSTQRPDKDLLRVLMPDKYPVR